jgi:methylated-DNA-[protein]-cysteine S-methyltransferase
MNTRSNEVASPVGALRLTAEGEALTEILFLGRRAPTVAGAARDSLLKEVHSQLEAYFEGNRRDFDLPLAPAGTDFQCRVWKELVRIPYGTTLSYGAIARRIRRPAALRAVGAANGRNPIPIIIPCHRVIGADGTLTGYGGGLPIKEHLLSLEGVVLPV